MNAHLLRQPHATRACEEYTHDELNDLARFLFKHRNEALAGLYEDAGDKRKLHFDTEGEEDGLGYKEQLWALEAKLGAQDPAGHGEGSEHHAMVRDGKCAELVMWWVHHLPAKTRTELSGVAGFTVPLLPAKGRPEANLGTDVHSKEYSYQVSCSDCHSTGLDSNSSSVPVLRPKEVVGAPPAGTCPVDNSTKLPSVWYQPMTALGQRKKRCDWDYDPPCGLCEGIGGYSWGDQEHQISYTTCKPVALAKDIPAENITIPVWPKSFVVEEVTTLINQINTGGRFPGADPCAVHKFNNDTEKFYFDDSRTSFPEGPIMFTDTSASAIYTLPTADMFINIRVFGKSVFCICVTPSENGQGKVATGPLRHDFAHDAVLIGREIIGLEGLDIEVEADHWNKGPHHFWVDVHTNLFVRGWQPWNGLNVYKPGTWQIGPVDKTKFEVPKNCYSGLLHKNISCVAPYPYK